MEKRYKLYLENKPDHRKYRKSKTCKLLETTSPDVQEELEIENTNVAEMAMKYLFLDYRIA
jgi:hypothetical protein